ncbi:MAG: hypothetical protein ACI8TF_001334 [Paracoccaceae bacterium]
MFDGPAGRFREALSLSYRLGEYPKAWDGCVSKVVEILQRRSPDGLIWSLRDLCGLTGLVLCLPIPDFVFVA